MGRLYIKGKKLWARFKDEHGRWKGGPTPYRPGDEAKARGFLKRLETQSVAKRSYSEGAGEKDKGPITVASYADRWVADEVARVEIHRADVTRRGSAETPQGHGSCHAQGRRSRASQHPEGLCHYAAFVIDPDGNDVEAACLGD